MQVGGGETRDSRGSECRVQLQANREALSLLPSVARININQHQPTSSNLNQHQPTSTNIKQPQATSTNINQHQATSTNINQHQPTSTNINQHQPTSININQHQATSSNIKQHQATSTNINQHQPTSSNIMDTPDRSYLLPLDTDMQLTDDSPLDISSTSSVSLQSPQPLSPLSPLSSSPLLSPSPAASDLLGEPERQTFYCVYSLTPIEDKPSSLQSPSQRTPLPTSGKLKPIFTNVPSQLKKLLHHQVLTKLQQSSFSNTGSIFLLAHAPPAQSPASLCFACLVSCIAPSTDELDATPNAPSPSVVTNAEGADATPPTSSATSTPPPPPQQQGIGAEGYTHLVCLLVDKQNQFDNSFELYPCRVWQCWLIHACILATRSTDSTLTRIMMMMMMMMLARSFQISARTSRATSRPCWRSTSRFEHRDRWLRPVEVAAAPTRLAAPTPHRARRRLPPTTSCRCSTLTHRHLLESMPPPSPHESSN